MVTKKQYLKSVVVDCLARWGVVPHDCLLVAVSGGVDSMTLLAVVSGIAKESQLKIVVGHINHGLRKTAVRDERLVQASVGRLGFEYLTKKVNIPKNSGVEERARELRYKALREMAAKVGAKYILTAHTADDQVETILFNFLRGAGIRGVGGMQELSGVVLRPFLRTRKFDLIQYANKHKIEYANDETNKSMDYTRNRIRHKLIPILRQYNNRVEEQILSTGELMRGAEQALRTYAKSCLTETATTVSADKVVLSSSKFRELDGFMQAEVLKVAMEMLGQDLNGISQAHFGEAARFVANISGQEATKRIGGKLLLTRGYDKITVSKNRL